MGKTSPAIFPEPPRWLWGEDGSTGGGVWSEWNPSSKFSGSKSSFATIVRFVLYIADFESVYG
jgi:hypothetical protein